MLEKIVKRLVFVADRAEHGKPIWENERHVIGEWPQSDKDRLVRMERARLERIQEAEEEARRNSVV